MSRKVTNIPRARNLRGRERVQVELPAFLVRAFEQRVREANQESSEAEQVDLSRLIELQLAECVSIGEIASLEREVPGVSRAASQWINGRS